MAKWIAPQFEMGFMDAVKAMQYTAIPGRHVCHIHPVGRTHSLCGWAPHVSLDFTTKHSIVTPGSMAVCLTCTKIARARKIL